MHRPRFEVVLFQSCMVLATCLSCRKPVSLFLEWHVQLINQGLIQNWGFPPLFGQPPKQHSQRFPGLSSNIHQTAADLSFLLLKLSAETSQPTVHPHSALICLCTKSSLTRQISKTFLVRGHIPPCKLDLQFPSKWSTSNKLKCPEQL